MAENICRKYAAEYDVPVKIARLANTFGPGVSKDDNRFFMQLAKSVIEDKNIVLHTAGESTSNFSYIDDSVNGLLTVLLDGVSGETYYICNDGETRLIREIAQMVADEMAGGAIKVVYDISNSNVYGYASDKKLKLDSSKLRSLGWMPRVGMKEAYERLVEYLKEN